MDVKSLKGRVEIVESLVNRLTEVLARIDALQEVATSEAVDDLQRAIAIVADLRASAKSLAARTGRECPSWPDRRGFLDALDDLAAHASKERERGRRLALAAHLAGGAAEHPVEALRTAFLDMARAAAEEIRATIDGATTPLPGPHGAGEWVRWGREHAVDVERVPLRKVADFLRYVPEGSWTGPREAPFSIAESPQPADHPSRGKAPEFEETPAADTSSSAPDAVAPAASEPLDRPDLSPAAVATEPWLPAQREEDEPPPSIAERPAAEIAPPPEIMSNPPPLKSTETRRDEGGGRTSHGPLTTPRLSLPVEPSACPATTSAPAPNPSSNAELALPAEFKVFSGFAETWWFDPSGKVRPAPWTASNFNRSLQHAFVEALAGAPLPFGALWIYACAVGDGDLLPDGREVEALAGLWAGAGGNFASAARTERLHVATEALSIAPTPAWRLRLVLEALAPSLDRPLTAQQVADAVSLAQFHNTALRECVEALLGVAATGEHPIPRVREVRSRDAVATPATARRALEERRAEFRKEWIRVQQPDQVTRIGRTHCRKAWNLFISDIDALASRLVPAANGGAPDWDPKMMALEIDGITRAHARRADKEEAKYQDRHRMDRMADTLEALARSVNDGMAALIRSQHMDRAAAKVQVPLDEIRELESTNTAQGEEAFARDLILRQLSGEARPDRGELFELGLDEFARRPDLLGAFATVTCDVATRSVHADARDVSNARRAAAVLHVPPLPSPDDDPLGRLMQALDAAHREELKPRVLPFLAEPERRQLHNRRAEFQQAAWARLVTLRGLWRSLVDLAVPAAAELLGVVHECERDLDDARASFDQPALYLDWLDRLSGWAEGAQRGACDSLLVAASLREPAVADDVRRALSAGRYADAHRILNEGAFDGLPPRLREARFRPAAREHFPDPRGALASGSNRQPLTELWLKGVVGEPHGKDNPLRTAWSEVFFKSQDLQPQNQKSELKVSCANVRDLLFKNQLKPSFVPQLSRFQNLVVLTPRHPLSHSGFVQSVGAQVAAYGNDLVALLAPGISPELREQTALELRRRGAAGIVDDLDLCRLLNPGGPEPNLVLALLEVLLEQQKWSAVTPFLVPDGKDVQLEMFVGRRDEARELARTARYSRLFSGRKLGKSALLRFIEEMENSKQLPSKYTLRVIYVSAVGVDSEARLVKIIEDAMVARFDMGGALASLPPGPPGERLKELTRLFLRRHENDSLLLVIDEADVFIEQQIEAYQSDRERCLSFQMRSHIETERDGQRLPRVRFVFSGYRVTHTNEGTWANWGDVLRLAPLTAEDAAQLVAGPLARLGIDCERQMYTIAYRCGYQPAVLLRLGERLVARLEESRPVRIRERSVVEVSEEDVSITFEDGRVQDEIRTVVRNNFQGNPVGRVVFAAVLLAFFGLPPGQPLADPEETILHMLEGLSEGDLGWLGGAGDSARAKIRAQLRDLVERQILVDRKPAGSRESAYFLRFPHHLPVLAPLAQEQGVRDEIRGLRRAEAEVAGQPRPSVFSGNGVELIRECMALAGASGMRALAVVGCHWPEAALHPAVGLPDRLGLDDDCVVPIGRLRAAGAVAASGRRVLVYDVRASQVAQAVRATEPGAALPCVVGGADVLRWAIGAQRADGALFDEEIYVEPIGMGRWSRATASWWFARVRGVNFPHPDAIGEILARTGGIPLLMRWMDQALLGDRVSGEGQDISPADYERALTRFDSGFGERARALVNDDDRECLSKRERELIQMLAVLQRHGCGQSDLPRSLTDWWDEMFRAECDCDAVSPSDAGALATLLSLGILPSRDVSTAGPPLERIAPLAPNDPLDRIASLVR